MASHVHISRNISFNGPPLPFQTSFQTTSLKTCLIINRTMEPLGSRFAFVWFCIKSFVLDLQNYKFCNLYNHRFAHSNIKPQHLEKLNNLQIAIIHLLQSPCYYPHCHLIMFLITDLHSGILVLILQHVNQRQVLNLAPLHSIVYTEVKRKLYYHILI